jgi:oligoribonuclease NrnB/cAMP/cGMP phosphodiesterase (DHH superfamily)
MTYTHILYHGNCYDGFGAAYVAWLRFGSAAQYLAVNYGQDPPQLPQDARVLICDFSYPRGVLLALKERVSHLQVIDHHKTAQVDLEDLPFADFNLDHSGAYLTWLHFFPGPVPEFIRYLEDRDLWLFKLPDSKGISQALRAYPFDFLVWDELFKDVARLRGEAPVIERFTAQMVASMCDHAVFGSVYGYTVPIANATVFFSEVGDELCRRNPKLPFSAYYLDREDGRRQWGLRSRNGFDTSVVAKALGGGGHPAASGFITKTPELGV